MNIYQGKKYKAVMKLPEIEKVEKINKLEKQLKDKIKRGDHGL